MPYIDQAARDRMDNGFNAENAGELNYAFTCLAHEYWARKGKTGYQNLNDIIGALEGAKAEFQRRVVAPYEDTKIQQNGDVP
jgi:hypothetical protein